MLPFLFGSFGFPATKDFKIIWLSNILTLSVPDEGYSKNASRAQNMISTFYEHRCSFWESIIMKARYILQHAIQHSMIEMEIYWKSYERIMCYYAANNWSQVQLYIFINHFELH
jgi:hypothetical protein